MSTASEMTLAAETMMATAASTTNAMAAVAAAHAAQHAAHSKSSPASAKLGFSIDSIVGGGSDRETKENKDRHSHIASAIAEATRLRDSLTVADFSLALAARNGAAADSAATAAAAAAAAAIHRPFNSSPNSPRSRHGATLTVMTFKFV